MDVADGDGAVLIVVMKIADPVNPRSRAHHLVDFPDCLPNE